MGSASEEEKDEEAGGGENGAEGASGTGRRERRQTLLMDVMRSITKLGVVLVLEEGAVRHDTGPILARSSYGLRHLRHFPGVETKDLGYGAAVERWTMGERFILVVRAPHRIVSWLAGEGCP
jgi:hypothetical protein